MAGGLGVVLRPTSCRRRERRPRFLIDGSSGKRVERESWVEQARSTGCGFGKCECVRAWRARRGRTMKFYVGRRRLASPVAATRPNTRQLTPQTHTTQHTKTQCSLPKLKRSMRRWRCWRAGLGCEPTRRRRSRGKVVLLHLLLLLSLRQARAAPSTTRQQEDQKQQLEEEDARRTRP